MAGITPEALERLRSRIGIPRAANPNRWNRVASRDAFRHFAWGTGDDNPLWLDPEYARSVGFEDAVAPPTWLYSCFYGPLGPSTADSKGSGLPGVHALHAGDDWEFLRPVVAGEPIEVDTMLEAVNEHPSEYAGRTIEQVILNRFLGADGEPVAQYRLRRRSHERSSARREGKWTDIEPWLYSDEDVESIAARYAEEGPRGTEPIDWATVRVGDEIPTRLKGPLTSTSVVAYLTAYGGFFMMTDRIAHNYMRLHPGAIAPDRRHNLRDMPQRAHWDERFVQEIGFPLGYDVGTQRISWFAHLLTDWIGDRGRILNLNVRLREPNWIGDLTTLHARITGAEVGAEGPTVKLDLWAESQRGRRHAEGDAVVLLGDVVNEGG
jgi:acyl dehydratase